MIIRNFAPVVIPTLCRYEHFKACLESLSRCVGSDETDVFIGLDYPAKQSHWEGYLKIKNYLLTCKHNFKSLLVIEREQNFGLGENGNFFVLRDYVLSMYDRVICTEDDNVFSPNFLEYINKGLEIFKDDKSILAINGYRHFYLIELKTNNYFRQNVDFSAWGYGIWKDRVEETKKLCNPLWFRKRLSLNTFLRVKRNGNNRARDFLNLATSRKPIPICDNTLSVYMAIENKDVIMPAISLVRNMGWDGSGENCKLSYELSQKHILQVISADSTFTFIGTGLEYYDKNREIYRRHSYARISDVRLAFSVLKKWIHYLLLRG